MSISTKILVTFFFFLKNQILGTLNQRDFYFCNYLNSWSNILVIRSLIFSIYIYIYIKN